MDQKLIIVGVLIILLIAVLVTKHTATTVEGFGKTCGRSGVFCFEGSTNDHHCGKIVENCRKYNTMTSPRKLRKRSQLRKAIGKCVEKSRYRCNKAAAAAQAAAAPQAAAASSSSGNMNEVDNWIKGYLEHEFTTGLSENRSSVENADLPLNPANGDFCKRGAALDACRLNKKFRERCQWHCTKYSDTPRTSKDPLSSWGYISNNIKTREYGPVNYELIRNMDVGKEDPCVCVYSGSRATCKRNIKVRDKVDGCKQKFYNTHKDKTYDQIGPISYNNHTTHCGNNQFGSGPCDGDQQRTKDSFKFDGVTPAEDDNCMLTWQERDHNGDSYGEACALEYNSNTN